MHPATRILLPPVAFWPPGVSVQGHIKPSCPLLKSSSQSQKVGPTTPTLRGVMPGPGTLERSSKPHLTGNWELKSVHLQAPEREAGLVSDHQIATRDGSGTGSGTGAGSRIWAEGNGIRAVFLSPGTWFRGALERPGAVASGTPSDRKRDASDGQTAWQTDAGPASRYLAECRLEATRHRLLAVWTGTYPSTLVIEKWVAGASSDTRRKRHAGTDSRPASCSCRDGWSSILVCWTSCIGIGSTKTRAAASVVPPVQAHMTVGPMENRRIYVSKCSDNGLQLSSEAMVRATDRGSSAVLSAQFFRPAGVLKGMPSGPCGRCGR